MNLSFDGAGLSEKSPIAAGFVLLRNHVASRAVVDSSDACENFSSLLTGHVLERILGTLTGFLFNLISIIH
jgi:hypothetical protein